MPFFLGSVQPLLKWSEIWRTQKAMDNRYTCKKIFMWVFIGVLKKEFLEKVLRKEILEDLNRSWDLHENWLETLRGIGGRFCIQYGPWSMACGSGRSSLAMNLKTREENLVLPVLGLAATRALIRRLMASTDHDHRLEQHSSVSFFSITTWIRNLTCSRVKSKLEFSS